LNTAGGQSQRSIAQISNGSKQTFARLALYDEYQRFG